MLLATACTTYRPPEVPDAAAGRTANTVRLVSWNIETLGTGPGVQTVSIEGSVVLDQVSSTQRRVDKSGPFNDAGSCYGNPTPGQG